MQGEAGRQGCRGCCGRGVGGLLWLPRWRLLPPPPQAARSSTTSSTRCSLPTHTHTHTGKDKLWIPEFAGDFRSWLTPAPLKRCHHTETPFGNTELMCLISQFVGVGTLQNYPIILASLMGCLFVLLWKLWRSSHTHNNMTISRTFWQKYEHPFTTMYYYYYYYYYIILRWTDWANPFHMHRVRIAYTFFPLPDSYLAGEL